MNIPTINNTEVQYQIADNSPVDLRLEDQAHHLHPFSNMNNVNENYGRIVSRGEGVYVWDAKGNKLLDGMAGLWCVNLGYGREELAAVAYEQIKNLSYYHTFFNTSHPPIINLSKALSEITPTDINHFFYCGSGSEANDSAIRIVQQYWKAKGNQSRRYIISRVNSYHGSTIAGASLGGMGYMHDQMHSRLENVVHIPQPYWFGSTGFSHPEEFGIFAAQELEKKILELGPENVGMFIGEPFQGAGGVIFPPETYWPEVQKICRKYEIVLVADEVIGGFGRTGNWFGHKCFNFKPDVITMAKGLTSGYFPMGAVGVSDEISQVIVNGGDFHHGLTYSGHPVGAAIALKTLQILQQDQIVENVKDVTGKYFQDQLRSTLHNHPLVGEINGEGLIAGIQLSKNPQKRERFDNGAEVGLMCRELSYQNNLIMRSSGDRMLLSPPLIIEKNQIDELVSKVKLVMDLTEKKIFH